MRRGSEVRLLWGEIPSAFGKRSEAFYIADPSRDGLVT
jgi:hypothetical protein